MTVSLDSEAEVGIALHLPVSSQKSVNFEPAGYSLRRCPPQKTQNRKMALRAW
jgi:hypothetical protein